MTLTNTHRRALSVVRAGGVYDLVVTVGFALPFVAPTVLAQFGEVHRALGLEGVVPNPDDVITVLLANLMGSLVTVWSVLRIVRPSLINGMADATTRGLFALALAAALIGGASPLLWGLLVPEVIWGVAQVGAVLAARGASAGTSVEASIPEPTLT